MEKQKRLAGIDLTQSHPELICDILDKNSGRWYTQKTFSEEFPEVKNCLSYVYNSSKYRQRIRRSRIIPKVNGVALKPVYTYTSSTTPIDSIPPSSVNRMKKSYKAKSKDPYRNFTKEQISFIRANEETMTNLELSKALGVSTSKITSYYTITGKRKKRVTPKTQQKQANAFVSLLKRIISFRVVKKHAK